MWLHRGSMPAAAADIVEQRRLLRLNLPNACFTGRGFGIAGAYASTVNWAYYL